jgi:hypothetical protein
MEREDHNLWSTCRRDIWPQGHDFLVSATDDNVQLHDPQSKYLGPINVHHCRRNLRSLSPLCKISPVLMFVHLCRGDIILLDNAGHDPPFLVGSIVGFHELVMDEVGTTVKIISFRKAVSLHVSTKLEYWEFIKFSKQLDEETLFLCHVNAIQSKVYYIEYDLANFACTKKLNIVRTPSV